MPNLGDIAYQTISGAISTATHGTGADARRHRRPGRGPWGSSPATARSVDCSADEEPEVFARGARRRRRARACISTVTLAVRAGVPPPRGRGADARRRTCSRTSTSYVDGNDHFEFFWVPHTGWALTKRNNRTDEPVGGMHAAGATSRTKILLENVAFGVVNRVGPAAAVADPAAASGSCRAGRGRVRRAQRQGLRQPALRAVLRDGVRRPRGRGAPRRCNRHPQPHRRQRAADHRFPVEVRFTAPDDIPLSTA